MPPDSELNVFEAAAFGRIDRLATILDEDPSRLDSFSPDGFTPLHLACFAGGARTTALLVERGAGLETLARASFAQVRPLGTAAFSGDLESARVLLDAGADPNGTGVGEGAPLHSAARSGNAALVRLLLERGADTRLALPDGRTAAQLAREAAHLETAALLD